MNTLNETNVFTAWLGGLSDFEGKRRILARIRSAKAGNFGDSAALGDGVSEMRVHVGPGYRIYFGQEGAQVYLLLLGGGKNTQERDIRQAKAMWKAIRKG